MKVPAREVFRRSSSGIRYPETPELEPLYYMIDEVNAECMRRYRVAEAEKQKDREVAARAHKSFLRQSVESQRKTWERWAIEIYQMEGFSAEYIDDAIRKGRKIYDEMEKEAAKEEESDGEE